MWKSIDFTDSCLFTISYISLFCPLLLSFFYSIFWVFPLSWVFASFHEFFPFAELFCHIFWVFHNFPRFSGDWKWPRRWNCWTSNVKICQTRWFNPNLQVISRIFLWFPEFPRDFTTFFSYSMDTDISTLEAPTFTTLSHGPGSNNVLQTLKWDHPPTLIGTKESEKQLFSWNWRNFSFISRKNPWKQLVAQWKWRLKHTVWKFINFPATQILCEINLWEFEVYICYLVNFANLSELKLAKNQISGPVKLSK